MTLVTGQTTRTNDYAIRLERVFKWLADHLDDTVDLASLADVACLSPYHFHRIYHSMRGETVTETVRRLRLHRAAVELITGELPVQRIARRAGYGSQEAFTRAFKAAYGAPPARYRASFVPIPSRQEDVMETTMEYQASIRQSGPIRVAALAHRGAYMKIGKHVRAAGCDRSRAQSARSGDALVRDSTTTTHRQRHPRRSERMPASPCPRDGRRAVSWNCARFVAGAMP